MRRIDAAILRELAVPFLLGTVAVVLMFQANLLIAQGKEIRFEAVPVSAIFQMVLFRTPQFLSMTLPVGMALASSLAMSRLARESELTAMRGAGIPVIRVAMPIVMVGVLVSIGNFLLVDRVMPASEARANKLWQEVLVKAIAPQFKSDVTLTLGNRTVSIRAVQRGKGSSLLLTGILLLEYPRSDEVWMTVAKSGEYRDGEWTLREPYVRAIRGDQLVLAKPEKDIVINEPIRVEDFFRDPQPTELDTKTLVRQIEERKRNKADTTALEIAYYTKFSVPAACLVFAFTGPLFAIWLSRSGPFVGVLLSIFMVLLYYNAFVISTSVLGQNGLLSPVVAAWLPNALFGFLGLMAFRRVE